MKLFVKPRPSKYTEGLSKAASFHTSLALQCAAIQYPVFSGRDVAYEVPTSGVMDVLVHIPEGIKCVAKSAGWLFLAVDVAEHAPDLIFPPIPYVDADLRNFLSELVIDATKVTDRMLTDCKVRVAAMALARTDTLPNTPCRPKIWAKSPGNTLTNWLKDYRFRPVYGGIRL